MKNQKEYIVYLLPLAGYVGVTSDYSARLRHHKFSGRDISYAEQLGSFKRKEMALRFEASFHEHPSLKGGRNKHRNIHFHSRFNKYQVRINERFIGNKDTLEEAIQLRNEQYKNQ